MIRVLHVFGGLGTGGTESLIMNWYRNIDREKIRFDFLVRSPDKNYLEEIESLGGRVYYTSAFPRHLFRNYRETRAILARREWDVIHVHGNAAIYTLPIKLAKKYGYPCRIMHSHNVRTKKNAYYLIHMCHRKGISRQATHKLACSVAAGEWMFPKTDFHVIHNAIDAGSYRFDSESRHRVRREYGLDGKVVVGHIGRFVLQKNHSFLLNTFRLFREQCPNAVLMLVGDGELEETVKTQAKELGILDAVLFLGRQSNVGEWLSAMDVFVLPSVYEGLGLVLLEAQCNGLPCVVSEEAYHEEVNIYPQLLTVLPLTGAEKVWAEHMQKICREERDRNVDLNVLRECGYDMKTEIASLEALYLQTKEG